jgi:branched-chain amino acid aminotransferase
MPFVWLNGNFIDESRAAVPLRDPGLMHGAGVFTTMRSYHGRVFRLDRHLTRLRGSCAALSILCQFDDATIADAADELLKQNDLTEARLRVTVSSMNVFVTASQLEPYPAEYYERGMPAVLEDEQKLNPYDIAAGHKTLNYMSRLAALRRAQEQGAGEAMWLSVHGHVESGSISNVFIVKDDELFTPPTPHEMRDIVNPDSMPYSQSATLPGITRECVIELARDANIDVRLTAIDVNMLLQADEAFLTNSIMQIMPVRAVGRRAIGQDRPGPLTRQLMERYAAAVTFP